MKLFILLTNLLIYTSANNIPEYLNNISICASLNSVNRTFSNIKEIYDEYQATGKVWNVLNVGSCLENNACKNISPVCAINSNNYYKTFPNQCLLETEQKVTGKVWKIVSNGVCPLYPAVTTTSAPLMSNLSSDFYQPQKSFDYQLAPTNHLQNNKHYSSGASPPSSEQSNLNTFNTHQISQPYSNSNSAPVTEINISATSTPASVQYHSIPTNYYQRPHPYKNKAGESTESATSTPASMQSSSTPSGIYHQQVKQSLYSGSVPAYSNQYADQSISSVQSTPVPTQSYQHPQPDYSETVNKDQDDVHKSQTSYAAQVNNTQYSAQLSYTTSTTVAPLKSFLETSANYQQTHPPSKLLSAKTLATKADHYVASDLAFIQSNSVPSNQQSKSSLNSNSDSSKIYQNLIQPVYSISSPSDPVQLYSSSSKNYQQTQQPLHTYSAKSTASQTIYPFDSSPAHQQYNSAPSNQQSQSYSNSYSASSNNHQNIIQPTSSIYSTPASKQSHFALTSPSNPLSSYSAPLNNSQSSQALYLDRSLFNPTPSQLYSALLYFFQQHFNAYGTNFNSNQSSMQSPTTVASKNFSTYLDPSHAYSVTKQNYSQPFNSNSIAAQPSLVVASPSSNASLHSSPEPSYPSKSYVSGSMTSQNINTTLSSNDNVVYTNYNATLNYSCTNNITSGNVYQNHPQLVYSVLSSTAPNATSSLSQYADSNQNLPDANLVPTNYNASVTNSYENNVTSVISEKPSQLDQSVPTTPTTMESTLKYTGVFQNSTSKGRANLSENIYQNPPQSSYFVSTTVASTTAALTSTSPFQYYGAYKNPADAINYSDTNNVTSAASGNIYENPLQPTYTVSTTTATAATPALNSTYPSQSSAVYEKSHHTSLSLDASNVQSEPVVDVISPVFSTTSNPSSTYPSSDINLKPTLNSTIIADQNNTDDAQTDVLMMITSSLPASSSTANNSNSSYYNSDSTVATNQNFSVKDHTINNEVNYKGSYHSEPKYKNVKNNNNNNFLPSQGAPASLASVQQSAVPYPAQYSYNYYPELSNHIKPFEQLFKQLQAIVAQNITTT